MPNVELIKDIFICHKYSNFKFREEFFSYRAYRHTDIHTDTQTHTDEYSIAAVDKLQL